MHHLLHHLLHHLHHLLEALRFLTVLPLPHASSATPTSSPIDSLRWFALVGVVVGVLLLPAGWLASHVWGAGVAAAVVVVLWVIISGGLHLDGLSDTSDGVLSWRPRERKLEIMKDSNVGAMGVIAIVAVLLLKYALLQAAGAAWWQATLLAPIWGRWAAAYGIAWFPAARASGLGHTFKAQVRRRDMLLPTATALLISVAVAQWHGIIVAVVVWGSTHLLARWWSRDLGGLTGDTYGALIELAEVAALAALT